MGLLTKSNSKMENKTVSLSDYTEPSQRDFVLGKEILKILSSFFSSYVEEEKNVDLSSTGIRKTN